MFDSPEAARRNGDRPGQNDWWLRLAEQFTGPVVFRNCTWVEIGRAGAHPGAGFVRIVEGRTKDRGRLGVLAADFDRAMAGVSLDLLGFAFEFHDEDHGAFSQLWYFTTADDASRMADLDGLPDAARAWMQEVSALSLEVRTVELREPWMDSLTPARSWPLGT